MRLTYVLLTFLPLAIASCQPSAANNGKPSSAIETPISIPVPAFSFTERSGKTITNTDLQGKVWVASFVFTRCTGSCPQVTATVAKLNDEFKDAANLRFVTFTVDPERDKLDDLKKYAQIYRADAERWLFLTGTEKAMHEFINKGFMLTAIKNENPKPGDEFDHSDRLALVDKSGHIRGYFAGMPKANREGGQAEFDESQAKLREMIAKLLRE